MRRVVMRTVRTITWQITRTIAEYHVICKTSHEDCAADIPRIIGCDQ